MAISNIFGRNFYLGTAAEMASYTPLVDGALFWCTDTLALYCYSGAAWNAVGSGTTETYSLDNWVTDEIWLWR